LPGNDDAGTIPITQDYEIVNLSEFGVKDLQAIPAY
jgi:hypothetical protein